MSTVANKVVNFVFFLTLLSGVRTSVLQDTMVSVHQRHLVGKNDEHRVCVNFRNKCSTETIFNIAIAYPSRSLEWRCQGWMNLPSKTGKEICWTSSDPDYYFIHINVANGEPSSSCSLDPEGEIPKKFTTKFDFCSHMQRAFDIFETFDEELELFGTKNVTSVGQSDNVCEDLSDDGCYHRLSFYQMSTDKDVVLGVGC